MQTIAVIDYGMGNLKSVVNALQIVVEPRDSVVLTRDPKQVLAADRIVFPGQGAAADCMRAIDEYGLRDVIDQAARQRPFLGICMGLQVLFTDSEENQGVSCLDVYAGKVRSFGIDHKDSRGDKLKIPHMGWNRVTQARSHPLWHSIEDGSRFYFVHSFYVDTQDVNLIAGKTEYGFEFTSAIASDNLFALQCHPEKSATAGLQLLRNFVNWDGQS